MTEALTFVVLETQVDQRLDRFLAQEMADVSRSFIKQLIVDNQVTVNGKLCKPSYPVQEHDTICVIRPAAKPTDLIAEDIPLDVVYEDQDIVIVNKPAGMVVHPAPGHDSGTLVHALLYRYPDLSTSGDLRPGIVHRIDKDTSGLMVIVRNDAARHHVIQQQNARQMTKRYLALVHGHLRDAVGVIDAPIARSPSDRLRMTVQDKGRAALTFYRVLEQLGPFSLIEATLGTGRTHQIRVHCAYKHRPVVGDPLYGPRKHQFNLGLGRQFLHAYQLGLRLPSTNEWFGVQQQLPADLQAILDMLGKRYERVMVEAPLEPIAPDWDGVLDDDREADDS